MRFTEGHWMRSRAGAAAVLWVFPHDCPGDGCVIEEYLRRKYSRFKSENDGETMLHSEAADGTVGSGPASLTTESLGGDTHG